MEEIQHGDETVAAARAQGRINAKVGYLLMGGMFVLFAIGLVPLAIWPCFVLGAMWMILNRRFALDVARGTPNRMAGRLMWILPIITITLAIHLLGELGSRIGLLMYFLLLTTGHDRRLSGFTPFQLANLTLLAFVALRLAEGTGWLAPAASWQGTPDSPALQLATVFCLGLILNCVALMSRETERTLAARAAALVALNRTLAERNAQLHHLQKEFERYASGVVHDLVNPLAAAIEGFTVLEELSPHPDGETRELALLTQRNMTRALEMLGGLREITKTVAAEEQFTEVRMDDVLGGVIAEFDLKLRNAGIRLALPRALPIVALQRAKMVQAWRNLLGNAIKYVGTARDPEIAIAYERTAEGHQFAISDNGIGIPPEFRARIFEPFERVPDARTIPTPGMGLGLTLVKRVMEQHGGTITVESEPGYGTTFRFTLPARQTLFQAA